MTLMENPWTPTTAMYTPMEPPVVKRKATPGAEGSPPMQESSTRLPELPAWPRQKMGEEDLTVIVDFLKAGRSDINVATAR